VLVQPQYFYSLDYFHSPLSLVMTVCVAQGGPWPTLPLDPPLLLLK